MLCLTKRVASDQDTFIDCVLHAAPGDCPEFPRSEMPRLVFEPSRPTMVGWRWDHDPDPDPVGPDDQHGSEEPGAVEFTYRTDSGNPVRALFPEGQSTYEVQAEIDPEGRTIRFPLPLGHCVHSLKGVLGLPEDWPLAAFIRDWLFDRTPEACDFSIDPSQSDSTDQGFEVVFNNEYATENYYKSMHLMVPEELLQDPIANGSLDLEDGFNPWNEEQKARIIAYLDPRLPRLISYFETTANSDRENQRFISEEWQDGLMPFVPAAEWILMGKDE